MGNNARCCASHAAPQLALHNPTRSLCDERVRRLPLFEKLVAQTYGECRASGSHRGKTCPSIWNESPSSLLRGCNSSEAWSRATRSRWRWWRSWKTWSRQGCLVFDHGKWARRVRLMGSLRCWQSRCSRRTIASSDPAVCGLASGLPVTCDASPFIHSAEKDECDTDQPRDTKWEASRQCGPLVRSECSARQVREARTSYRWFEGADCWVGRERFW